MLLLMTELSSLYPLIGSIDTTANQLVHPLDDTTGKMQHMKIVFPLYYSVLSRSVSPMVTSEDLTTFAAFERVSNSNKTDDVSGFIRQIVIDSESITQKQWGRMNKTSFKVEVMIVDNAAQLANGVLQAFRSDGRVDSHQSYHDMVFAAILRHEGRLQDQSGLSQKARSLAEIMSAKQTHRVIKDRSPCLLKVCANHTRNAMKDGCKHMESKPDEIKLFHRQFSQMFGGSSRRFRHGTRLSELIPEIGILLVIYSTKRIKLPEITSRTVTRERHNSRATLQIATDQVKSFKRVAKEVTIKSDGEMLLRINMQ